MISNSLNDIVQWCAFAHLNAKIRIKNQKKHFFHAGFRQKNKPQARKTHFSTLYSNLIKKLKTPPLRRKPPLFPAPKTGKTGKKILPLRKGPKC